MNLLNFMRIITVVFLLASCGDLLDEAARPQEPIDRPYEVESVNFAGGVGVTLAGELTTPRGPGPHKAVILISGSGPQDRNEALAGHKPFLVLSDYLTRNGIAVLRYDDRGFAESTGSYALAALPDFADDAAGALRFLQNRPEIDSSSIGFIGHSEGGYIAPLAAKQVDPAFMVLLAGAINPLLDVVDTQTADIMRALGASESSIETTLKQHKTVAEILKQTKPISEIRDEIRSYLRSEDVPADEVESFLDQFATPWGIHIASYEPRIAIAAFEGPVLALFGEKDLQVSALTEAAPMRANLQNASSEVHVLDGLNHLFQPAQTGLPSEYFEIETTFAESAMRQIAKWINSQ